MNINLGLRYREKELRTNRGWIKEGNSKREILEREDKQKEEGGGKKDRERERDFCNLVIDKVNWLRLCCFNQSALKLKGTFSK